MQDNGTFVIDAVAHAYNLDPSNYYHREHAEAITAMICGVVAGAPGNYKIPVDIFVRDWTVEDTANMLFLESDTDLAVFHPVPITAYKDGLVSVPKAAEAVKRWPDRFLAYATLDPLRAGDGAVEELERQFEEYKPIGLKLYPSSWGEQGHSSWRMDDEKVAYPLYEKCRELGIRIVAVHKAVPFGPIPLAPYNPTDVEGAAADFPDLQFEIVHGGFSFVEETAWMLVRFPNVWINLEGLNVILTQRPLTFAKIMLGMAALVGDNLYERCVWASGAMSYHPQASLDALEAFTFPEDMLERAGHIVPISQITQHHKRMILADNYARLANLDIEARKAAIADDEFAQKRRASRNGSPYSTTSIAEALKPWQQAPGVAPV